MIGILKMTIASLGKNQYENVFNYFGYKEDIL